MTRVKICGITNEADALAAVEAGAHALGFILYPKSKRFISPEAAGKIIEVVPPFVQCVAVLVNAEQKEIEQIEKLARFDAWQLHGEESAELCVALKPRRLIKAVAMSREFSPASVSHYPVDAFLLDTPAESYGGSGKTFDWELAVKFRDRSPLPVILSGGLTPENVASAIEQVQPYAVDVCSGVEEAPGRKDHARMHSLLHAISTISSV